jgi:hypothetical protein
MLPVRAQLGLVFQAPLPNETCCTCREATLQDFAGVDAHERLMSLVLDVKCGGSLVIEIHANVDAEEIGSTITWVIRANLRP